VAVTEATQTHAVLDDLASELPKRSSRAEETAQAVERRIVGGKLPPGTRLGTRRDLGELLGVAPSTLSEAIKLLEDRGRVTTRTGPGGGVFVAEPAVGVRLARSMMSVSGSAAEVAEALEVRDALEAPVILGAARTPHKAGELAAMRAAMRAVASARNAADRYLRILEFHAAVADICGNAMLRTLYKSLLEIIQSHRPRLALLPGENEFELAARRVQIHQEIADAIAAGDVAAAEAAVRVHATHHARNP